MKASFWLMLTMAAVMLATAISLRNILNHVSTAQGQNSPSVLFSDADITDTFRMFTPRISASFGEGSPVVLFTDADHQETFLLERPGFMPAPPRIPPPATLPPPAQPITAPPAATARPPEPPAPLATPEARIAFVSNRDGDLEIYVANSDGSSPTKLTDNSVEDNSPSWSPDGLRIAFMSDRDGDMEIYVMNVDGSGVTQLTDNSGNDLDPAWSPDGRRIAFAAGEDTDIEIYVISSNGSRTVQLTDVGAVNRHPRWSPDGRRIAFISDRDEGFEIYMMDEDGSNVTQLTDNTTNDLSPSWAPDGHRITFASKRDGDYELYVMNVDGSGLTRLTDNSAYDGVSSWSPDGRRIVFTSDRNGNYELYVMNADGTGVVRLTDNAALDGRPSWPPAQVRAVSSPDTATPSPAPSNRPTPVNTPTPAPTPTTSPPPTPAPGGPVVDFHAATTKTRTGQPMDISLGVVNLKTNPDIDVHVVLRSPTGLLLSGDSCPSVAQCSDTYELSSGAQSTMSLKATATETGKFTMEAYVTWRPKDGEPAHLKESLTLNMVEPVEGETEVTLHATQTEIKVGQPVRLNLSAINSIVKPPMTLKLVIEAPSGWSLTGTGFATACGSQCSATYILESGQPRYIDVDMVPNQPGSFEVEARMEWYFGDDTSTLERKVETLQLNVLGDPTPTPGVQAAAPADNDASNAGTAANNEENWIERNVATLAVLLVAGIVILIVLGWIFGRPFSRE